jgi:hypothetical protein
LFKKTLKNFFYKNKYGNIIEIFDIEYPNSITKSEKNIIKENFKRFFKQENVENIKKIDIYDSRKNSYRENDDSSDEDNNEGQNIQCAQQ